jgi:regulation of enolase protein 1 (concanavalin A-like superfamily)
MGITAFERDDWQWLNEPRTWSTEGGLTVTSDPETDFWRTTHYGYDRGSGHVLGVPLTGDFTVAATFTADYAAQYDQAGVALWLDERNWIKAGVELVDDEFQVSTVVTREFSDWSVVPAGRVGRVTIAAVREGDAVTVRYGAGDAEPTTLLRLAYFPPEVRTLVGVMAAAPTGPGFTTRFDRVQVTPA